MRSRPCDSRPCCSNSEPDRTLLAKLYRAYLAQSDIFIGLYWQRYGWVGPGMDISGLEDEFRLFLSSLGLLYVKRPAPDREPGPTAMIDELQTKGTTRTAVSLRLGNSGDWYATTWLSS